MPSSDCGRLRARLVSAYAIGSFAGAKAGAALIEDLYADTVDVWHNYVTSGFDGPRSRSTAIDTMNREREAFQAVVTGFEQHDLEIAVSEEAILITLKLSGNTILGTEFSVPLCVIYRRDFSGKIVRTETWADGTAMQTLGRAIVEAAASAC